MRTATAKLLLFVAALGLNVLGLNGCGESKNFTPGVAGALTITPDVLPFEGGVVRLDWYSDPPGSYVREHATSGVDIQVVGAVTGRTEIFELMHLQQKMSVHSSGVVVRPQWRMPAPIELASTSRVQGALSSRSGILTIAGETQASQAGNALGGFDLFVYQFAATGKLQSSHQIGSNGDDRLIGLKESSLGTHVLMQTGNAFTHALLDETGIQASKTVTCLDGMGTVWDWLILADQTLLTLASKDDQLHVMHCGKYDADFKRLAASSKNLEGTTVGALFMQGSQPAQALIAITTSADLGAGNAPHPQPQLLRIDMSSGQWSTKRLASTPGSQWLGAVVDSTSGANLVQLLGQTRSSISLSANTNELWLMQASIDGGFSGKTPLFEEQAKSVCCVAYKQARGARSAAWLVGTVSATSMPALLTAMQVPDLDPLGTIEIVDTNYASLDVSAIALDASGDFYVIGTALRQDQTRWLRIEQFNEMGQSRIPALPL